MGPARNIGKKKSPKIGFFPDFLLWGLFFPFSIGFFPDFPTFGLFFPLFSGHDLFPDLFRFLLWAGGPKPIF